MMRFHYHMTYHMTYQFTLESITAGISFLSKEVTLPLQAATSVLANDLDPDQDRLSVWIQPV